MPTFISHCQFLFADVTFQKPLTPLESALNVLETICTEMDVEQRILEQVHTSIREMVRPENLYEMESAVCGCILFFFYSLNIITNV